jgi:predicted ribosome quality control (RQC) complex YloA/Tae2 family protein
MMNSEINSQFSVEALKQEAKNLNSVCKRALKRIRKKIEKQEKDCLEAARFSWFSQVADSLVAHPDSVSRGASNVRIMNIHTQEMEEVSLHPDMSVFENAQELYKRARKGKRGLETAEKYLQESRQEERTFVDLCTEAERLSNVQEISLEKLGEAVGSLSLQLQEKGVLPRQSAARGLRPEEETVPYRHLTIDGWDVYIGKNDAQNDELTTRFAKPWDIWMHVAAHAGSHVVLRRDKNAEWPPRDILLKVAAFAVWFSKAKHTSYAEVNVTEARFVRKRRHSPPGEVIAERCKTLRVSPKSPQEYFLGSEE